MIGITRRTFLVQAGATSAAVAGIARGARANTGPVRVGVIGVGQRGRARLHALRAIGHETRAVRVTALCDAYRPRAQAARGLSPVEVAERWERIVEDPQIDAVVIATPDHHHATMTLAALEAGKDVFCEPPMGLATGDAERIREAAARTGRIVQYGADPLAAAGWQRAAQRIASGELGTLRRCQALMPWRAEPPPLEPGFDPAAVDWPAFLGTAPARDFDADRYLNWTAYSDYSAGSAAPLHFDFLLPLLALPGLPALERVSTVVAHRERLGERAPGELSIAFDGAGGLQVVLTAMTSAARTRFVLHGTTGQAELGDAPNGEAGATHGIESLTAWLAAITTREPAPCGPALASLAQSALEATLTAARSGVAQALEIPARR